MKLDGRGQFTNKFLMNVIISSMLAVSSAVFLILLLFLLFLLTESSFFSSLPVRPYSYYIAAGIALSIFLLVLSVVYLYRNVREVPSISKIAVHYTNDDKRETGGLVQPEEDITRFLDAGEREIYGILVDAGGTLLQREISSTKGYSKATITRILNRLEAKGLIEKLRHGSTNKIIVKRVSK